jgi:sugar phosphate isomerase/epimerase
MDRRTFIGAAGLGLIAGEALAAGPKGRKPAKAPPVAAPAPPAAPQPMPKIRIDAYSRQLQWLRSAEDVAKAVIEMGYDGIDVTVRTYPGHVDPAKVETDLPAFVKVLRDHGLRVDAVTTNISDADSPYAEPILKAASALDIHHYWWGTYRYDQAKPVTAQLEALKPRVERLAALNARYGMKAMYHTYSGSQIVGAALWDFLEVLRNFDPAHVSFHYDIGHQTNAGGNGTWATSLRAAGPYIGGVSVKDSLFELNLPLPQGGPYTGAPAPANAGGFEGPPPGPGATPGSAPPPRQGAQPSGRGGGGQPNPWRVRQVPLGEGTVNLPLFGQVLKEISFAGPVEIQAEYPNGGADAGQDKITLPQALVLGAMKRDRLTLEAAWRPLGLI